jgi:hypothetical protein
MSMIGLLTRIPADEVGALRVDSGEVAARLGRAQGLSVEKMWQALHYLLTGEASDALAPLGLALLGGAEIGEDLGYGPPRLLEPEQVRAVAQALAALPFEQAFRRFDPAKMEKLQIYPGVWDEPEEDLREELKHHYEELVAHYAAAARSGDAMLLAIT